MTIRLLNKNQNLNQYNECYILGLSQYKSETQNYNIIPCTDEVCKDYIHLVSMSTMLQYNIISEEIFRMIPSVNKEDVNMLALNDNYLVVAFL